MTPQKLRRWDGMTPEARKAWELVRSRIESDPGLVQFLRDAGLKDLSAAAASAKGE